MNERLLTVNVIPVQDSFVHLSSKLIRQFNIATINKHPVSKYYDDNFINIHNFNIINVLY